jgi:hypothetical protein
MSDLANLLGSCQPKGLQEYLAIMEIVEQFEEVSGDVKNMHWILASQSHLQP